MWQPHIDDRVRLTHDIPELSLHRGDSGVVRSVWFAPILAYEVEFYQPDQECQTRALLMDEEFAEDFGTPVAL
jgi:Domain of unknown function (DUF4926)